MPAATTRLALSALASVCAALAACSMEPGGESRTGQDSVALASGSTDLPPLPEPFDSSGCHFHRAVYRPHPDWERPRDAYRYTLRIDPPREHGGFYEARLVFEARDRRSGTLAATLRLDHTTGNGLARHTATTANDALKVDVQHMNRDLGFESQGTTPRLTIPASYAIHFTDLERELYYRHGRWEDLDAAVTFHTSPAAKPIFPNRWLLAKCGRS